MNFGMKLVKDCAWCKKLMNEEEFSGPEEIEMLREIGNVSHGICPECFKKEIESLDNEST